jgi:hypothetical protein
MYRPAPQTHEAQLLEHDVYPNEAVHDARHALGGAGEGNDGSRISTSTVQL